MLHGPPLGSRNSLQVRLRYVGGAVDTVNRVDNDIHSLARGRGEGDCLTGLYVLPSLGPAPPVHAGRRRALPIENSAERGVRRDVRLLVVPIRELHLRPLYRTLRLLVRGRRRAGRRRQGGLRRGRRGRRPRLQLRPGCLDLLPNIPLHKRVRNPAGKVLLAGGDGRGEVRIARRGDRVHELGVPRVGWSGLCQAWPRAGRRSARLPAGGIGLPDIGNGRLELGKGLINPLQFCLQAGHLWPPARPPNAVEQVAPRLQQVLKHNLVGFACGRGRSRSLTQGLGQGLQILRRGHNLFDLLDQGCLCVLPG